MTVNLDKTKVIVFRKGGFVAANEAWKYGNEDIEVVNRFHHKIVIDANGQRSGLKGKDKDWPNPKMFVEARQHT
ncbi:hypothetical protein V1264_022804 [Littorina saxatilis]|uniref:Uncharacterized protein n=1 Tax=Littorina saxatilis TaxID=31220 RepID=A0AAN9B5N8_9CAEN